MLDPVPSRIELYPSRILLVTGGGLHLLAGIAVAVCGLAPMLKVTGAAGIAGSLVWFGYRYGSRCGRGFIARIESLGGRWRLETGDGATHRADLIGGYAHPAIVILNFRLENGRRRSLTLLPDSADLDALRRLRVWLRTTRGADISDPPL
jgi:hypothetical protein